MNRLSKRTAAMAASAMQAGLDTAVTIAARTPALLSQGFSPTAEGARETQRMIQEKIDAVVEGYQVSRDAARVRLSVLGLMGRAASLALPLF